MNFISIDLSKYNTGIFYSENKKTHSCCIKQKSGICNEYVSNDLFNTIGMIIDELHPAYGLIEGYALNPKNRQAMIPLCEIGGVVRSLFFQKGIPLITIPVQTWKSYIKMPVDKRKKPGEYLEFIAANYQHKFETIDEADAYLIYRAFCLIVRDSKQSKTVDAIKAQYQKILKDKK